MNTEDYRTEHDALGEVRVPADVLWGAQTQRAVDNFPISGRGFPRSFIRALARVKQHAAETNVRLGELDEARGEAIAAAAREVLEGKHDGQFPVDVYQTGSGTSTNMNMNEVLAHVANAKLHTIEDGEKGVHPNDHVNRGQSSNDAIPTAMHLAVLESVESMLLPSLDLLRRALGEKAQEFADIAKVGRTHLMDAVPLTLGQEFSGYTAQIAGAERRIRQAREALFELPLGGTAVGTGLNAHPEFAGDVIAALAEESGLPLREAANHFEAQGARDAAVEFSAAMKTVAVSLMKIANDLRWMSSGPRAGLAELLLPEVQPGSSIMPGKINPVIPEAVAMVCARVIGNDATVTVAGQSGNFELNVMIPVIAVCLLESAELLANAARVFATRCVSGIRADADGLRRHVRRSLMLVTALVPAIGYEAAAGIAQEAYRSGKTVREVALERSGLEEQQLERLLGGAGG
jgi:fumarate hydratase class II